VDSEEVRRGWAERSGEFSPEYYAYHGPDETSESVRRAIDRFVDRDASVLELGCSSGRHLAHLHDDGWAALTGVEVNGEAFEVMREVYPELAAAGSFHHDPIEDVVAGFADGQFAATYSVETLQHIHPDETWVFDEVARVTDAVLITVENEGDDGGDTGGVNYVNGEFPLYYRDWEHVFTTRGFTQVAVTRGPRDTMRTFRPTSARSGR
jgi:SAM-dependent methyltransferase